MKHDGSITIFQGEPVSNAEDGLSRRTDVGIFSWDVKNNNLSGNEFLAEVFGLDVDAVGSGLPVEVYFDAVVEIDRPQVAKSLHKSLVSNTPCYQEYRVKRADGSETLVTSIGHCFRDVHGEPTNYAGVIFDREVANVTAKKLDMHSHCLAAYSLAAELGNHTAMRMLLSFLSEEHQVDLRLTNQMNVLH